MKARNPALFAGFILAAVGLWIGFGLNAWPEQQSMRGRYGIEAEFVTKDVAKRKLEQILSSQDLNRIERVFPLLRHKAPEFVRDSPLFDSLVALFKRADKLEASPDNILMLRDDIIRVLVKSGDSRVTKFLVALQNDSDPEIRATAEAALTRS